ncbi:hypothetical protein J4221_05920 [Candidatus Pacearchaeota archaeon]|nr:hypothetical protein [Candidatus Pacearchaeota archaeon]
MKLKIGDIIIWILVIISIAVALWYFFGNSPTLEEVILTFLLTVVFTMGINLSRNGMRMNYIEKDLKTLKSDVKESFNKIKEDMNLIKNKLKIK